MTGFNPFIFWCGVIQVIGCVYGIIKDRDLYTFIVYMCYAFANIAFAFGPSFWNKMMK